jgi:hypothetical protein
VDGIFLEVHDNPAQALSDGTNALPIDQLSPLLEKVLPLGALSRELDGAPRARPPEVSRTSGKAPANQPSSRTPASQPTSPKKKDEKRHPVPGSGERRAWRGRR